MQKVVIISFIVLLFISQGGYYIIYAIRQYQIREEVKEQLLARLPESYLEVIMPDENPASFTWLEEGREFSLHGQLYDVAKTKTVNGKKVLYCLKDSKEQQLLEERSATQSANNNNATDKGSGHTIKFQLNDCIAEQVDNTLPANGAASREHIVFNAALYFSFREVTSPPPQL